jgi:hypothetical protein
MVYHDSMEDGRWNMESSSIMIPWERLCEVFLLYTALSHLQGSSFECVSCVACRQLLFWLGSFCMVVCRSMPGSRLGRRPSRRSADHLRYGGRPPGAAGEAGHPVQGHARRLPGAPRRTPRLHPAVLSKHEMRFGRSLGFRLEVGSHGRTV